MNNPIPLVYKYRPTQLINVITNTTIRDKLQTYIKSNYLPHLLFVGETGTGKNLMANCLVRDYLNEQLDNKHFYQICGSINRKRDIVSSSSAKTRDIKSFIKIQSNSGKKKIVLIRDFHCMTTDAQTALRTVMEKHANSTCFILTCNNQDDLVEAIQSRVIPMVFTKTSAKFVKQTIDHVILTENMIVSDEVTAYLAKISDGKIGVALNHLQLCNGLSLKQVTQMFDINIRARLVEVISLVKTSGLKDAIKHLQLCIFDGYQPNEIFRIIIDVISTCHLLDRSEQFNILRDVFKLTKIVLEDEAAIYLSSLVCILHKHAHV